MPTKPTRMVDMAQVGKEEARFDWIGAANEQTGSVLARITSARSRACRPILMQPPGIGGRRMGPLLIRILKLTIASSFVATGHGAAWASVVGSGAADHHSSNADHT